MAFVSPPGICIDRYEASRGNGDRAESVAGAMPWSGVAWKAAQAACEASGKRLCTKDEWHAACAGPPPGRTYPTGEKLDPKVCNARGYGAGVALPTGSLKGCVGALPELHDLAGNVWEWTSSCENGKCRVRGGSFRSNGKSIQCAAGVDFDPRGTDESIGFRCCKQP